MPAMTHADPGPVVQRILLGAELRDARESRGMSTADATKALGWYAGKLSKIEQGDLKLSDRDLTRAIRVYNIEAGRADVMQRLATDARRKLPPARVAEWATKYVNLVAAATEIRLWTGDCFPGTVQTADYARAVLARSMVVSAADVDRMADDRAKRVERLKEPDAARLWLVVGEEALHRQIGGAAVLRGQLEQVRVLSDLPNVMVQVIPFDHGAHPSLGVAFSVVTLVEGRPGVVYVEGLTGSDYLGREHVRVYTLAFDDLRSAALSQQRTMELINRRISEL